MTATELCNFCIKRSQQIATAISTGAGWEIWLQVDLLLALRELGYSGARELPYRLRKKLDILTGNGQERYAIEMKVESAFKTAPFLHRLQKDCNKIRSYSIDGDNLPLTRWVLGIFYSPAAKESMLAYSRQFPDNVVYQDAGVNNIAVVVVTVPR